MCAVCVDVQNVCAMGWMLFVEIVQLCADGRPARLCSGVLSGALEHVKRMVVRIRMCFVCDAGRCWVATEVSKSARTSLIRAPL